MLLIKSFENYELNLICGQIINLSNLLYSPNIF